MQIVMSCWFLLASLSLSLSQQFQQLLKYVANVLEERGDMLLSTETSDL